jgi:hypothetical protein
VAFGNWLEFAIRDMIVAGLTPVFSILFICYSRNTGHSFRVYWAPFFLAGGALLLRAVWSARCCAHQRSSWWMAASSAA